MPTGFVALSRFTGLWRHPDFLRLWTGQTISLFGSLVGGFALDMTAIIVLKATPLQITLLSVARLVPGVLVGLLAGLWVDRLRRRPILIGADIGRAVVLGSIPVAALLGLLRIEQLYLVAVLVSVLSVCFDVAYRSYLPSLVSREELMEGNSKLQASGSAAEAAGFGVAGMLVQALTAPIAILVDALSFLVSALSVALIRTAEPTTHQESAHQESAAPEERAKAWREIGQGLRLVLGDPVLRAIAATTAIVHLFQDIFGVVIMLFFIRELHLSVALMGPLFALGGISSFGGAAVAERVVRAFGLGRTLLGSRLLTIGASFFIPLAGGAPVVVVGLLAAAQIFGDGAATVYDISQVSLVQATAPRHLQGRVHAVIHVVEAGAAVAGYLIGGVLGQTIGLRPTLLVGCIGALLAALRLALSPVRALRGYPVPPPPLDGPSASS